MCSFYEKDCSLFSFDSPIEGYNFIGAFESPVDFALTLTESGWGSPLLIQEYAEKFWGGTHKRIYVALINDKNKYMVVDNDMFWLGEVGKYEIPSAPLFVRETVGILAMWLVPASFCKTKKWFPRFSDLEDKEFRVLIDKEDYMIVSMRANTEEYEKIGKHLNKVNEEDRAFYKSVQFINEKEFINKLYEQMKEEGVRG